MIRVPAVLNNDERPQAVIVTHVELVAASAMLFVFLVLAIGTLDAILFLVIILGFVGVIVVMRAMPPKHHPEMSHYEPADKNRP